MEILKKYSYANKYYAKIQDNDRTITEISSVKELTDEEWESLYGELKRAENTKVEYELEAEDGETV